MTLASKASLGSLGGARRAPVAVSTPRNSPTPPLLGGRAPIHRVGIAFSNQVQ